MKKILALLLAILMLTMAGCTVQKEAEDPSVYFFPSEEKKHEGTWLARPHKYSDKQSY